MSEENKFGPKKSWTRIFRKKWFFPSMYLMLAALLISAVFWYQNNGDDQVVVDDVEEETDDYSPVLNEEPAEPVMGDQEVIELPVANPEEAEVLTKFFDYDADESDKVNALIHYNNRYYQSTGIDIARSDGEAFEVIASLSGTVSEVKEDPLLGNVVVIEHEEDVRTFYASLGEVSVEVEDSISQGDVLGTAGNSTFGKDNGTHVHFEIRKEDTAVNPEALVSQPLASLDEVVSGEEAAEEEEGTEEAEETEELDPTESIDEPIEEDVEEEDNEDIEQEDDGLIDEEDLEDEETEEDTEE